MTDHDESEFDDPAVEVRHLDVLGYRVRVAVRAGKGEQPPLLMFNGIGANLELLRPFATALEGIETVVFDIPGVGGSSAPVRPYRLWNMARLANRLMSQLGHDGPFDVLGVSWGGLLAQQFAVQYPKRCRKLVLAATSQGVLMVGRPSVLSKMISPRRFRDPDYLLKVGAGLYGGVLRRRPDLLAKLAGTLRLRKARGYFYQMLAAWGWTSVAWLPLLRQPTLIIAGTDDPIMPLINAKILAALIRDSTLHVVDDGHLFLVTRAGEIASVVRRFLQSDRASGEADAGPQLAAGAAPPQRRGTPTALRPSLQG